MSKGKGQRENERERKRERERERESERERGRERQREKILTRLHTGLDLTTLGSGPELKLRVGCSTD